MESLLEMNPNKFGAVILIFALVILPIILGLLGIEYNMTYAIAIAPGVVIFLCFIYPKITKNKEAIAQIEEGKKMREVIKKQPDYYKIQRIKSVAIILTIVFFIFFIYINQLRYIGFVLPIISFSYLRYYSKWMQNKKSLGQYGKKMEAVITNGAKWGYYGFIISTIIIIFVIVRIFVL